MTRLAIILAILAAPAHAVTGNASVDNPGQTTEPDPAPDAAPPGPEGEGGSGAVRHFGDDRGYNFDPEYTCVPMVCDKVQGGDR